MNVILITRPGRPHSTNKLLAEGCVLHKKCSWMRQNATEWRVIVFYKPLGHVPGVHSRILMRHRDGNIKTAVVKWASRIIQPVRGWARKSNKQSPGYQVSSPLDQVHQLYRILYTIRNLEVNKQQAVFISQYGKFVNRNYAWFGLGTRPESDMKKSHGGKNNQ